MLKSWTLKLFYACCLLRTYFSNSRVREQRWANGINEILIPFLKEGITLTPDCLEDCVLTCYWGCNVQKLHEALQKHVYCFRINTPQALEDALYNEYLYRQQYLYPFLKLFWQNMLIYWHRESWGLWALGSSWHRVFMNKYDEKYSLCIRHIYLQLHWHWLFSLTQIKHQEKWEGRKILSVTGRRPSCRFWPSA